PGDPEVSRAAVLPADGVFFSWEADEYPNPVTLTFTSYAACTGSWFAQSGPDDPCFQAVATSNNGLVHIQSNRRIADITDGTSHTLMLGERGHGLLSESRRSTWHWTFGVSRVMFTAQWPPNPQKSLGDSSVTIGPLFNSNPSVFLLAASSF